MRNVKFWGILVIGITMIGALFAALQTGQRSPLLASGTIALAPDLNNQALGLRTLFVIVHDSDSKMPMPYGAMKETLSDNAAGDFLQFHLTKERIAQMNPNAPTPKFIRIKARLDQDGVGGMDQSGDITGQVDRIAVGSENIRVTMDTLVP